MPSLLSPRMFSLLFVYAYAEHDSTLEEFCGSFAGLYGLCGVWQEFCRSLAGISLEDPGKA